MVINARTKTTDAASPFAGTELEHNTDMDAPPNPRSRGTPWDGTRRRISVYRIWDEWRRNRMIAAQDWYVEAWQSAWAEGASARWNGQPPTVRSYRDAPQREAWTAGWMWANRQPDRRVRSRIDPNWAIRTRRERRRAMMSHAKRGMWTVALIMVARWMWQSQAPQSRNVVD